ncbi:MAG: fused MFS/spermidine synthase [Gammaproteobacteria bacterium]|nr:fused MFS/spermidine synthase [Gammaproteobacteria bacterium]
MLPAQRKIALYASVVFLSSALLLVLEIVAARLIAPYVGVSLYTWSAVIGIVLAGLSIGNALGGAWADRHATAGQAGGVLLVAGLSALAIPWLLWRTASVIEPYELSILGTSMLLVLVLFMLPALLIGIVTPLLTTLALAQSRRTGHIVGMMHALGATGSIFGTFITAWWLIPMLGSRNVVLCTGLLLLLCGLLLLRPLTRRRHAVAGTASLLCAGAVAYGTLTNPALASSCDRESSFFCIRVIDEGTHPTLGQVRSLVLDHLLHGINVENDGTYLEAPYVHLMQELVCRHHHDKSSLDAYFVGGGAYTQPRALWLSQRPTAITVAELDPVVTEVARETLFLDDSDMRVIHGDARVVLDRLDADERFDVIVGDAFHDVSVPYHLVTREFARLLHDRLRDDGLYVLNLVDVYPGGRLAGAMVRTLRTEFAHVEVWLDQVPREATRVTYVISASDAPTPVRGREDNLASAMRPRRQWTRVTDRIDEALHGELARVPVLTDDNAPVEQLISALFTTDAGR